MKHLLAHHADLVLQDSSFHAHLNGFDGHNGFGKNELDNILQNHGFEVELYKECFTIEKKTENGVNEYPLFLNVAKKK